MLCVLLLKSIDVIIILEMRVLYCKAYGLRTCIHLVIRLKADIFNNYSLSLNVLGVNSP